MLLHKIKPFGVYRNQAVKAAVSLLTTDGGTIHMSNLIVKLPFQSSSLFLIKCCYLFLSEKGKMFLFRPVRYYDISCDDRKMSIFWYNAPLFISMCSKSIFIAYVFCPLGQCSVFFHTTWMQTGNLHEGNKNKYGGERTWHRKWSFRTGEGLRPAMTKRGVLT